MAEKKIVRALARHKKFSLDTSCFIYLFEGHKTFGELAKNTFEFLTGKELPISASSITLTELLRKEEIYKDKLRWETIKSQFLQTPNMEIVFPDLFICEKAAQMGAEYNLLVPDAIHIASGILSDADVFVTNDPKFKRVKEIAVIVLKDFIVQKIAGKIPGSG